MSNLHRDLAPISAGAWEGIDGDARTTFTRYVAGRRIVDMPPAAGLAFSSLTTGRVERTESPRDDVRALRREVLPVIELRAEFTISREEIDDVDRGSVDSDWQPAKDAAAQIAQAEDSIVFHGLASAGINGLATHSSNDPVARPEDVREFPDAVSAALSSLRLAGVGGPYSLVLPAELYTQVSETVDHGFPIYDHVKRMLPDGHIVWGPGVEKPVLVSERGGDYELHLGEDLSIGYLSHDDDTVRLYAEETMTFRIATSEASVVIGR